MEYEVCWHSDYTFVHLNMLYSAGDVILFKEVISLHDDIPQVELRNNILHFNFDAFINAVRRYHYYMDTPRWTSNPMLLAFYLWRRVLKMVRRTIIQTFFIAYVMA